MINRKFVLCVSTTLLAAVCNTRAQIPTISGISPNTGVRGSSVTIAGSNFNTTDTSNIVWFGAAKAAVTAASGTSLTVTAPTGATYDRITVLNKTAHLLRQHTSQYMPTFNGSAYIPNTINYNSKVDFSIGGQPTLMAAGDLDGDGWTDIVAARGTGNTISVLRNTGTSGGVSTGTFSSRVDFTSGSYSQGVAIGDIDGDGKPDIVTTNYSSNTISIYRNTSSPGSLDSTSFAAKVDFAVDGKPTGCVLGDLDGDGKLDIVVSIYSSSTGSIDVFRNTSTSGSITSASLATLFYLNGPGAGYAIAIGDINDDGKPDIAVGSGSGIVSVFRNTYASGSLSRSTFSGPYNFTVSTGIVWDVTLADLDGDNKPEIVTTNGTSNMFSILRNIYNGSSFSVSSFAAKVEFACGSNPGSIAIADFNGDEKPDLACTSYDEHKTSVLLNRSSTGSITTSSFAARITFSTGSSPWGIASGDFDGDGKTDLASANCIGGTVSVLRNNPISPIAGAGAMCPGTGTQLYDSATNGTWSSSSPGVATVSSTGRVTAITAGTAIITYAGLGASDTALITVLTVPAITAGSVTLCNGNSATITASGASTYSWSAASWLSGTTGASVTASPTVTSVCTVTGTSTFGCTASVPVTVNVIPRPSAAISAAIAPCVGYTTGVVVSGTTGATVAFSSDSGATQYGALTGGTFTFTTAAISTPHNFRLININNSYCTTNIDTLTWINPLPILWTGTADSNWNNGANWSCGFAPGIADSVTITAGTPFQPVVAAGATVALRSINIPSGSVVTAGSGGNLNLWGQLTLNGIIDGNGIVRMNGSTAQLVSGRGSISNLDIDNTAGVQVGTAALLTIGRTLYITNGTLTTNDSLVLNSDSAGTARVAPLPSGTAITGNVRVKQYVQGGMRRFRFWSHPFSNNTYLSQLTDDIDVTGNGGAANGFTATASNAPSAYRYNPVRGNSSLGYDPGWVPFTSASRTADSNAIHPYQGIRLFLRGAKGEGLGYLPYTPSPVTITQSGPLNQGNISVTLQKGSGSNQDYNMIGNTYPSPVDIGTVLYTAKAAGQITGSAFYVWNPAMGAAGQFQAHSIGVGAAIPYYLAANSAFQVRAAFSGAVLNFTEENKHETAGAVLFRSVSATVALGIYNNAGQLWDRLDIRFNQQASDAEDCDYDAAKLHGPGFNFYSLTPDRKKLAIDVRKYTNSTTIPLGLASDYEGIFTIRVESAMLPDDGKLYLHDRTTEQYTDLLPGTEYKFSVTKDNRTQGDERFELTTVTHLNPTNNTLLQCTLQPNPATNEVTVAIVGAPAAETNVSITNTAGTLVYQKNFGHQSAVKQTIPLSGLASGWYMVQITNGPESICKKLIKE